MISLSKSLPQSDGISSVPSEGHTFEETESTRGVSVFIISYFSCGDYRFTAVIFPAARLLPSIGVLAAAVAVRVFEGFRFGYLSFFVYQKGFMDAARNSLSRNAFGVL